MKKVFFTLLILALIVSFSSSAYAQLSFIQYRTNERLDTLEVNENQAFQSTDSAMVTNACKITSIHVTAQSAGGIACLYDNASAASGTVLADISVGTDEDTIIWQAPVGMFIEADNGIYLDTTNAECRVFYQT